MYRTDFINTCRAKLIIDYLQSAQCNAKYILRGNRQSFPFGCFIYNRGFLCKHLTFLTHFSPVQWIGTFHLFTLRTTHCSNRATPLRVN